MKEELSILRAVRRAVSRAARTAAWDFQGADIGLFAGLVDSVPWDVVPRGQGSKGRMNIVQENNLKGAEAGCPHVLREELSWLSWEEDWLG